MSPRSAGARGQFVAREGTTRLPYDGHTLATVIPHTEGVLVGNTFARLFAEEGITQAQFVSGQKRGGAHDQS
ncbi:hypothetical protein [Bradyrhizobium forestalis]|uniref:hypothetical protein n=1 Tax=Bradyrhizobium forestalis TaxID=1419263 RepID=UPI0011AF94A8|nr:hypothetical protein [Bradyrhizobium forestalis]